jgi:hypothetical protein
LLFLGIENRDSHIWRSEKIVFAVASVPKGTEPWADGREDPAASRELIVYFRFCGGQRESEDTSSRRGGDEFSHFPMHGFSDYRERSAVASLREKLL